MTIHIPKNFKGSIFDSKPESCTWSKSAQLGLKIKRLKEDCFGNAQYAIIQDGFLTPFNGEVYDTKEAAESALLEIDGVNIARGK